MARAAALPRWAIASPLAAGGCLVLGLFVRLSTGVAACFAAGLIGAVIAAVHRAAVIASGAPAATVGIAIACPVRQGAVHRVLFAAFLFLSLVPGYLTAAATASKSA